MKIDIKEIREGKRDGQLLWICDYRIKDVANKPIRHVEPQQVIVRPNDDKHNVYYSESHFAPLNAKGLATSKVLAPFDNTGYRSFPGTPVQVFDNEIECREAYKQACKAVWNASLEWKESVEAQYAEREKGFMGIMKEQNALIEAAKRG
jgi:hypothetical protein